MALSDAFKHLAAGLSVGLSGLVAGFSIGVIGDVGSRALAQQPRLFTGNVYLYNIIIPFHSSKLFTNFPLTHRPVVYRYNAYTCLRWSIRSLRPHRWSPLLQLSSCYLLMDYGYSLASRKNNLLNNKGIYLYIW